MKRRNELIKQCQEEPEKVADLILALEARIKKLENSQKKNSQNSNKPPSSDGLRRKKIEKRKKGGKVGGQKGHKGKTLKFSEKPDKEVKHEKKRCEDCGRGLEKVEGKIISRRQEIEIVEKPVEIIEHQRLEKECPHCGKRNKGEWPIHLKGKVQYGRRFRGFCVYVLNYQLLPYERTGELLKTLLGYQPGGGTLQKILAEGNEALEEIEGAIKKAVRASPIAHGDETSIRVNGKTRWLHVLSTQDYTYYYWSKYRGQKAHQADGTLPDYEGILMHDAYQSYFGYSYAHALCNAHLLRELQALYEDDPKQRWTCYLKYLLGIAWGLVKKAKAGSLKQLPQPQYKRIVTLFKKIVTQAAQQNPPAQRQPGQRGRLAQSPARNLLNRLIQHQDAYLRFASDFRVPFDNNLAERDLRMAKLQQKISGCFRTDFGADIFCRIRAYISTLRKLHLPLLPILVSLWSPSPFFPFSPE